MELRDGEAEVKKVGEVLVKGHDLGVFRGGRWLVRHVNLLVRRGEIVTLIGPNGSGKSTTAKTILGLVEPDEGELQFAASPHIGYVPQSLKIDSTLPLTTHRLLTLTHAYSRFEIEKALERVGARTCLEQSVQSLSGGEFQRVLMARALLAKPDLLVLDEPVQGVDYAGEIALYELIKELRDELDCGILLISHDLHIVMAATDTVLCLNGHVCCSGTPHRVANDPEYQKLFGARAVEALAVYHHDHDHHHHDDGSIAQGDECGQDACRPLNTQGGRG